MLVIPNYSLFVMTYLANVGLESFIIRIVQCRTHHLGVHVQTVMMWVGVEWGKGGGSGLHPVWHLVQKASVELR